MPKVYITTPAYYPNDVAHIGHAYTTIATDVLARWYRLKIGKENVMFITGLDEHGSKLEKAARERGMEPQAFVDMMAGKFKDTWKALNISYDGFRRTSDKKHIEIVKKIFKKIYDAGDIYKGQYEGWYCTPCESFWTDMQLVGGKCPECGRDVEKLKEESYFFRLSKYQNQLLGLYKKHPEFISPSHRKNEIINRVKEGLKDLSISRMKVKWGIPVPLDKKSTIYCWFDALNFYLSVLDYPGDKFKKFWPPNLQLMSKEINWFHSVIFPAILLSAKLPIAKKIFVHGWLTVEGKKMSKSLGNFLIPEDIVKKYGVDQFRYFLMREIPFGEDGDFSEEALVKRINGELVSDLGNLASRVLTLAEKFQGSFEGAPELDKELDFKKISGKVEKLELHHALDEIWAFIRACNKYINDKGPWKLEGKELGHVLYNLLEGLRVIAILIRPFMPDTSEEINRQLGVKAGTFKDLKFRKFEGKPRKGKHLFEKVKAPGAPTEAKGPEARKISVAIDKGAKNLGINAKAAVISGVKVKKKHSGLEKLKKETSKSLKLDVSGERNIQGFKELYKKLGADISKHPLELLLDAVKKTGKIPTINTVVDSYNLVAAKRLVSAGAHDLDRIEGNVRFKVTDGTEPWTPLGTKGKQKVPKGEYACVDEKKVICRMDVKQCEQTKVGENTKNVFLYVQGNKNIPEEELAKALEEACQNIVKFCGGSWKELLIQ